MERSEESLSTRDLAPADRRASTATDREFEAASPQPDAPDRTAEPAGGVQAPTSPGTRDFEASGSLGSHETRDNEPLLDLELGADFLRRWEEVQTRFVDEPRGAVQEADSLVAKVMEQIAEGFAQERERLEALWSRGENISTEDLRVVLQRYRSFFRRLLST